MAAVIEREGHHTSADDLRYYVEQVIDSTAENISSMLQDIHALRHTEIDYITGYLLKRARAHGIAVPENARLFEMVKRKESEYERSSTGMSRLVVRPKQSPLSICWFAAELRSRPQALPAMAA